MPLSRTQKRSLENSPNKSPIKISNDLLISQKKISKPLRPSCGAIQLAPKVTLTRLHLEIQLR